jgi:subtilisin-like proprotein convertase family protein
MEQVPERVPAFLCRYMYQYQNISPEQFHAIVVVHFVITLRTETEALYSVAIDISALRASSATFSLHREPFIYFSYIYHTLRNSSIRKNDKLMKKIYLVTSLLLWVVLMPFVSLAQSFTNNTGGNIPDNNTLTCYPVTVSGLASTIDSTTFGLISVCISILHNRPQELDVSLRSPNGTTILLTNNNGGPGANFTNTCFIESSAVLIQNGSSPFSGSFVPIETINHQNNRQNPNGTWNLCIKDEIPNSAGSLVYVTLRFGNNPPPTPELTICTLTNGTGCKCPDGSQNCDLLPDLTNSAKAIVDDNEETPNGVLRIGVATPNIGAGPVEIRSTSDCYCDTVRVNCSNAPCPDGSAKKQRVVQRYYHKNGGQMTFTERPAGNMSYHPTHGHIHMDNWTYNSLRIKGPDKDPGTWPIIGTNTKVSFCLVNLSNCTSDEGYCKNKNGQTLLYDDIPNAGLGSITGCGLNQGIYPGYLDIYSSGYDGQDIPVNGLCNGEYFIVSITDPTNMVKEMDETNNVAVVPYRLTKQLANCCVTDFIADTLEGEAPFTVRFTDMTAPNSKQWRWNFGDGSTDTTQFPVHVYTRPGVYDVSLNTVANYTNCNNTRQKKQYVLVKRKVTEENPYAIGVFPNPTSGAFSIVYQLKKEEQVHILLYDASGRKLRELYNGTSLPGIHEEKISPNAGLPAGIYIVEIRIKDTVKRVKVVKQ